MREPAERPDALYDFLYKDIGRIASYDAQVFGGRLTVVEQSSTDRNVQETTLRGTVAVAGLNSGLLVTPNRAVAKPLNPMMSSRLISSLLSSTMDLSRKMSADRPMVRCC